MDHHDVGDVAAFVLTVDPADGTTTAAIAVIDPLGQPVAATPSPNDSRSRWTANVALTRAGIWRAVWTVTGTGAGVEPVEVFVRPDAGAGVGHSYATTGDLAEWLGEVPPVGAARKLARATKRIDEVLYGAAYAVDADGMPTEPRVIDAFRDAVCAQVQWWATTGDPDGTGAGDQWDNVQIGSVKLARSSGNAGDEEAQTIAPDALRELVLVGLIRPRPRVVG